MSHISWVQTPVNARGKKSRTVFFLPKFSLSFTSTSPVAVLDFRLKSGALDPTEMAIVSLVECSRLAVVGRVGQQSDWGYRGARAALSNDDCPDVPGRARTPGWAGGSREA